MKKLFTILAMVIATIIISSCSEESPVQAPVEEEYLITLRYSNPYMYDMYIHVWVYDDKGVFQEQLGSQVGKISNGTQYVSGVKKNWVIYYGKSKNAWVKDENSVEIKYKLIVTGDAEYRIE